MNFNINEVIFEMLDAIKVNVGNDWDLVKVPASNFFQSRTDRLELLSSFLLQGGIDEEFKKKRLEEERSIIQSNLHAIAILNAVASQNAANAAIEVLSKAISLALTIK
jgi:hypothetical protein